MPHQCANSIQDSISTIEMDPITCAKYVTETCATHSLSSSHAINNTLWVTPLPGIHHTCASKAHVHRHFRLPRESRIPTSSSLGKRGTSLRISSHLPFISLISMAKGLIPEAHCRVPTVHTPWMTWAGQVQVCFASSLLHMIFRSQM